MPAYARTAAPPHGGLMPPLRGSSIPKPFAPCPHLRTCWPGLRAAIGLSPWPKATKRSNASKADGPCPGRVGAVAERHTGRSAGFREGSGISISKLLICKELKESPTGRSLWRAVCLSKGKGKASSQSSGHAAA